MGLFDLFTPKTVSSKYCSLLKLFKSSHSSFTITREEKNIIKFTFGYEDKFLIYGSIEQYFDSQKLNIGNYKYDLSKVVIVSLHTSMEGTIVKVEKSFYESEDQTSMYNTVMSSFLAEFHKVITKMVDEEEEEYSNNTEVESKDILENNIIFVEKWELLKFAKMFSKASVATVSHKDTGKEQRAFILKKEDGRSVFVNFFSDLGELTPQEIVDKKEELYIGKTYFLFSNENKGLSFLPVEADTKEICNKEYILDESSINKKVEESISINQILTEDQKSLLAIFLNNFTDRKDLDACRKLFDIGYDSTTFDYWCEYPKGWFYSSATEKEYHQKMYDILSTVRNMYAIHKFISGCCNYSYFLYKEDYIMNFKQILTSWGFSGDEVDSIIDKAKETKYLEYKKHTNLVPFQDFMKVHGNIIKTGKAVDNETGELFFIFALVNAKEVYTYMVACPYLGDLTVEEIKENQSKFLVRYGKEGCFYLCTKDSDTERFKYIDVVPEYYDADRDFDLEHLLMQLNITPELDAFTVDFNDELQL